MSKSNQTDFKVKLLPNRGEVNSTVFVLGATGSGKSTLIANLLLDRSRFVVIDSKRDYDPAFFGNLVKVTGDLNKFVDLLNNGCEQIIFSLHEHSQDKEETLSVLLQIVFEFQLVNSKNLEPLTVALDELDSYVTSRGAPVGIKKIIEQGRSVKIQKIFGAQWFGDVPTWARDTFSEIYTFAHYDKNGLLRLEQFGFNAEHVKNLPAYVCAYVGKGESKTFRLFTE